MSLLPHEQFLAFLSRAERPVILLPLVATTDDFATAFGLCALLTQLNKPTEIICAGGTTPTSLSFLSGVTPVHGDLQNIRSLTINVNVANAQLDEFSYVVVGENLRIHLTPKSGEWQSGDVAVATNSYKYDLIITIGAADLAALGPIGQKYADFIFNTPVINLDYNPSNDHFGALNVVDVSAVACGEVVFNLMSRLDESIITPDIATCFLTGMVAQSKSFKTPNVTPKTLKAVGSLMNLGARRDEIVAKLYRTRSVATLRLWGRALARLKVDAAHSLVWTLLTHQDFVNAGSDDTALDDIVEELLNTSPDAKVVAIFYEQPGDTIAVRLHAERPHDALSLGLPFKSSGTRAMARLTLNAIDLVAAEKTVITHLQKELSK